MRTESKRWTDYVLSFVTVRIAIWIGIARYAVPGWLDHPWNLMEYMDEHQHHALDLVGRISYAKYHQFPLWNPYWCGGTAGIAEPESIYLAPDFIIRALWFGVERGRHIVLLFGLVLAIEGMFRLARKYEASAIGATFAAVMYSTQLPILSFVHDGAFNFLIGYGLIPWAVLCFEEGLTSVPWRLLGGFFVAWIFLCAGTYPTPYALLVLGLIAIAATMGALASGERGAWMRPWTTLATMGFVSFLLTAAKLFPLLSFLGQNKRTWLAIEMHPAAALFGDLSGRYPWVIVFALVAVMFLDRRGAFFLGMAGLFFLIAMGDFDPASPYHVLHNLPLLGQLRNPERYMAMTMFFLCLGAARGISQLEDAIPTLAARAWGRDPVPRFVHGLLVAGSAALVFWVVWPRAKTTVTENIVPANGLFVFEAPRRMEQPFRQARGNRRDIHVFNHAGLGSLYCIVGIPVPQSPALRADLPAEEYPLDPATATVKRREWTPNWIELDVVASAPATVIVNQNWNKHFRASVGRVVSHQGLLAVEVPPGTHRLRIEYVDRGFMVGLVLSGTTLLALIVYAAWYANRRFEVAWKRFRNLPLLPDDLRIIG
ncbi:MAG: hypothetical protein ACXVEE_05360 [Polyangiales bacterium]